MVGFVFMPEHLHLLVHLTDPARSIGRCLARVKQPFSKQIKEILVRQRSGLLRRLTVRERTGKACFRFRQEGSGYDRNLFSLAAIQANLDDIHKNPVKRGLCRRAVDWRWSSARFYLDHPASRQHAGLPLVHGLPADALAGTHRQSTGQAGGTPHYDRAAPPPDRTGSTSKASGTRTNGRARRTVTVPPRRRARDRTETTRTLHRARAA